MATNPRAPSSRSKPPRPGKARANDRLPRIGAATSQIVTEAAALLDEELAAGIVAARRMEDRFQRERRIDSADFQEALSRFQNDAHEVVNLLHRQFTDLQTKENQEVIAKLVDNSHSLLDLVVGLVNIGVDLSNQLIRKTLPQQPPERGRRAG